MPLPGILGGFETRQKHFFFTFLEPGKKSGKIGFFFRKKSGFIGIYPKNRRFFAKIFSNDFFHGFFFSLPPTTEKSVEISDFFFLDWNKT